MTDHYEPSPDFVAKVMGHVRDYEASKACRYQELLRYLAAGSTLLGLLRAAPVF